MEAPLSVHATGAIKVKESCNCCSGFFSKPKEQSPVVTVTEEVFQRTVVRVRTPERVRVWPK